MESKVCPRCKVRKPLTKFYKSKYKSSGSTYCAKCSRELRKIYYRKSDKKVAAKKHRQWCIRNMYGITLKEYDDMFVQQGGKCATCGGENTNGRRLYIDHCHERGTVRGLLCHKCNSVLGCVGDDTAILENLISYLKNAD